MQIQPGWPNPPRGWHPGGVSDVRETKLPGVGVRHDFTTTEGRDLGVIVHHDGRREVVAYGADDPDACTALVSLSGADARTLSELLGASQVTEEVTAVQQQVEGLVIDWIELGERSTAAGTTIASGAYRTRTGASIVAIMRGDRSVPAPEPDFVLEVGDVAVSVGTSDGLTALRDLLG